MNATRSFHFHVTWKHLVVGHLSRWCCDITHRNVEVLRTLMLVKCKFLARFRKCLNCPQCTRGCKACWFSSSYWEAPSTLQQGHRLAVDLTGQMSHMGQRFCLWWWSRSENLVFHNNNSTMSEQSIPCFRPVQLSSNFHSPSPK